MTPIDTALSRVDGEIAVVRDWPTPTLVEEAERCADLLASNAVMLWWPESELDRQRRRAGQPLGVEGVEANPDDVVTALARGLAILALREHGVEFDRMHLCDHRHGGLCQRGQISFPTAPEATGKRGATFTPRALAEMVTVPALEPLVYRPGPLDTSDTTQWRLIPPIEILALRIGDIAVGTGVFPLAALRYLVSKIAEQAPPAWVDHHLIDMRASVIHCLYGVDIHPGSIAIARIVMALMVPTIDMDIPIWRRMRVGDSLLGVTSLEQIRWMHLDPKRGRDIHGTPPIPDEWLEAL